MQEISGRTFTNEEQVDSDGVRFVNCDFQSVSLVYRGGDHPEFLDCKTGDVAWLFKGPALKTIQLLQMVNNEIPNGEFLASVFKPGVVFDD